MAEGAIRLERAEWRDLAVAQRALLAAQLTVWLRPRGALLTRAAGPGPVPPAATDPAPALVALVRALDRAARYGPLRPHCLVRAIALARLLQSRGYTGASVRVGVRKQAAELIAHAWVEYGGAVIGEGAHDVSQFVVLSDVEVGH